MKVRFIGTSLAVTAFISASAFAADEIHFTLMGQNAVTFDWRGANTGENMIRFGETSSYDHSVQGMAPDPYPQSCPTCAYFEARITGLKENTLYHYSIAGGPDKTFKTSIPYGSSGFTVDTAGDIGDTTSYPNMGILQKMIAANPPTFFLGLGDNTYGNAHGMSHVDQHFNDVMLWSQTSSYMPAWGNHEWDSCSATATSCTSDNLTNYKGRFDLPNQQASPGAPLLGQPSTGPAEDWYYFAYGNVLFIMYPEPFSGAWVDWSKKADVLMSQAQADPKISFIVSFGHRPAYSSGHHAGASALASIIGTLGAKYSKYVLNLNGHSHNYERTFPQSGVMHITAGGGGANLEQDGTCLYATCTKPSWSNVRYMRQGVLRLEFSSTGIKGSYLCGPAGAGTNDINCNQGDVIDSFVIGAPSPTPSPSPSPTVSPTPSPSPSPTVSPTPSPSPSPTVSPTPSPTTSPGSLVFRAVEDATIRSDSPSTNYGSTTTLEADGKPIKRFLMKFVVSGVGTKKVTKAVLRLYNVNSSSHGGSFYRVASSSWSEASVTYNNQPAHDSTAVVSLGAVSPSHYYDADLTPAITGDGTYSFMVITSDQDAAWYSSREAGATYAPQLTLTVQ